MRAHIAAAFVALTAGSPLAAPAQAPAQSKPAIPPLPSQSARTQRYSLDAKVSEDLEHIAGRANIEFTNPSPGEVDHLEFHLYWNGWKNTNATWLREQERGAGRRPDRRIRESKYSSIDVRSMRATARGQRKENEIPKLAQPVELLSKAKFISPDDNNPDDETVLSVPLGEPLRAGESLLLTLDFDCVVPRIVARTGRKDDFLLIAHWYPQLGVYERRPNGTWAWNCHQFHANTEFFGEYANYDVTLNLPAKFDGKVGATGSMVEGPTRTGDDVRYRFVQEDVHNFAFTADPNYVVVKRRFVADDAERDPKYAAERDRVRAATELPLEELRLRDVDVTILLQPEHADQADRHFRAVVEGLRWYGLWYGRYPYATLTVVDPRYGSGAGGMEYPTLFTAGTRVDPTPRAFTPESVTIHEFGHQHFYGLLGSNEFEHAWLDEGFNTYSTSRTLAMAYGAEFTQTRIGPRTFDGRPLLSPAEPRTGLSRILTLRSFAWPTLRESEGMPILRDDPSLTWIREQPFLNYVSEARAPDESTRASFLGRGYMKDRMDQPSWAVVDGESYGHNSYQKPATLLYTLERIVGSEKWARVMRAYSARHRFQHPRPEDFFQALLEFAGTDVEGASLSRFIGETFRGSNRLDYGVSKVSTRPLGEPRGWFGKGNDRKLVTSGGAPSGDPKDTKKLFDSEFVVNRLGEVSWPVTVEWKREGESPQRETWDGAERWWRKQLPPGPKLEWVRVDPERKLWIDENLGNNSWSVEGEGRPSLRWSLRALMNAQTQLSFFSGLR
jgi:hypothetical protein